MKPTMRFFLVSVLFLLFVYSSLTTGHSKSEEATDEDYTALKVCEGVIQLFKQFSDSIWSGYDLAKKPFIFYMPERWALLFNYSKETEGFAPYPDNWPDLGTDVLYCQGQYGDLAGQLAFELSVDTVKVAATSYSSKPGVDLFAFIVHENFHQYQFHEFGEIPWEREQKYPIEDAQNTALAYLEMRLLMDALQAAKAGDDGRCRDYVRQFVAVRDHRWKHADPFVAKYEQGKEINEGTAKYVELKSIDLMTRLRYESSLRGLISPLLEDFGSISMPEYLLADFADRMTGNSVSPEDMARNRIYPVGSAQAFLLDYLGVEWKKKAQQAGPDFTFAQLLREELRVEEDELEDLAEKAKEAYAYHEILTSTDSLIQAYQKGFSQALSLFEAQDGFRVEIDLSSKNLRRSRSSSARKWLFDSGTRELCSHFDIYVLKSMLDSTLFFQLRDAGLLDENDWDARTKKMVFFVPEIASILLDGKPIENREKSQRQFKEIEVSGKNLKFSYCKEGTITINDRDIRINLIP